MAKTDPIERELNRLRQLKLHQESDQQMLGKALLHQSNLVVSKAAELAVDFRLDNLSESLEKAFEKWLMSGDKTDPGCRAKTALAKALCELELSCEDQFLVGYQLVQKEKAFGGPVDTAGELRGLCGLGLVRSYCDVVLECLADLLADQELVTRAWAARALLEKGGNEAAALARFRLAAGEDEPAVVFDCLTTLIVLTKDRGIEFAKRYLKSPSAPHWPVAILALGESREPRACDALVELYAESVTKVARDQILEAIALSRLEQGLDFLFKVLTDSDSTSTEEAEGLIRQFWGDSDTLSRLDKVLKNS